MSFTVFFVQEFFWCCFLIKVLDDGVDESRREASLRDNVCFLVVFRVITGVFGSAEVLADHEARVFLFHLEFGFVDFTLV